MPKPFVCLRHLGEFLKEQREVRDVCQVHFEESVLVFFLETCRCDVSGNTERKILRRNRIFCSLKHYMIVSWTLKTNVLLCTVKGYTIENRCNVC